MTSDVRARRFGTVASFALLALAVVALAVTGGAAAQSSTGSNFDVLINATNEPVTENSTLQVEVVVENTGDETDSQEITLETDDGVQRDSTTVALDAGAQVTRNLSWETESGDAGDYTINVSSEDDFETASVSVNDVPDFDVGIDSTNEPVREGDTLAVDVTIDNDGGSTDTQEVTMEIDGRTVDRTAVGLDGGDSETVTLEWETAPGDAGDYEANVSSRTDTTSTSVTVNAPPSAAFTREPATPNVNEAVVFDASDTSDSDGVVVEYTWQVDGENVSGSETLSYTFTQSGEHEVRLYVTDNDGITATTTRTITVNAPPEVSIPSVDVATGEEATFEPNVTDDGTVARYEWYVDGELITTDRTLRYTFDEGGTHQVRLEVTDDNGATAATTRAVDVAADPTPTPTEAATATATESGSTETASPAGEEQPGFGPLLALVALVATALFARRRR